jgi:hypothetical protein
VILDKELESRLRKLCSKEGKSMKELVERFIREGLNQFVKFKKPNAPKMLAYSMGKTTVDPADRSRLWDMMDDI